MTLVPLNRLSLTLIIAILFSWLLFSSLSAATSVSTSVVLSPALFVEQQEQAASTSETIIGEPCGHHEKLPEQSICLYGFVVDGNGRKVEGARLTVTNGEDTITGNSSRHPGEHQASYGIDLSPLAANYLQPLTVTASSAGITVSRVILTFPDYRTHNQRFDLRIPITPGADLPADAALWGYVYDYVEGKPVLATSVIVEHHGISKSAQIALTEYDPQPIYYLTYAQLNEIADGNPAFSVTMRANVQGVFASGVLSYSRESQQQNVLAGWPCDTDGILPGTGGGKFGLPGTGGGKFGLPDEACFYGTIRSSGEPIAGVYVYFDTGRGEGLRFDVTKSVADGIPHFAVRLDHAEELEGKNITVTTVYKGNKESFPLKVALNQTGVQNVDFSITAPGALDGVIGNQNSARWCGQYLWSQTSDNHIQRRDPRLHETVIYSITNAFFAACDSEGRYYWFSMPGGVIIYDAQADPHNFDSLQSPAPNAWNILTKTHGLVINEDNIPEVSVDANGNAWLLSLTGATQISPTPISGKFTISAALETGSLIDSSYYGRSHFFDPQQNVWISTNSIRGNGHPQGLRRNVITRIDSKESTIATFSGYCVEEPGEPPNTLWACARPHVDALGNLWIVDNDRFSLKQLAHIATAPPYTKTIFDIADSNYYPYIGIVSDKQANAWLINSTGLRRIGADTLAATDFTAKIHGLGTLNLDGKNNLWVSNAAGVSQIDGSSLAVTIYRVGKELVENSGNEHCRLSSSVCNFTFDNQGNGWYLTPNGVSRIDGRTLQATNYTTVSGGLIENRQNIPYHILFDQTNTPWIWTDLGVSRVDSGTLSIRETSTITQMGLPGTIHNLFFVTSTKQIVAEPSTCAQVDGRVSIYSPDSLHWRLTTWGGESCFSTLGSPYLWATVVTSDGVRYQEGFERSNELQIEFEDLNTTVVGSTTYTLHVVNRGEAWVDPTLTFQAPAGSQVLKAQTAFTSTTSTIDVTSTRWQLPSVMPQSGAITVSIQVMINGTPGQRLLASASVTSTALEAFLDNNHAEVETILLDRRPDVRVTMDGPISLQDGDEGVVRVWVENAGGLDPASNVSLQVTLPPQLTSSSPLRYHWDLLSSAGVISIEIPVRTVVPATSSSAVTIVANVTANDDSDTSNNQAQAIIPTISNSVDTLFVVAGDQMVRHQGHGASVVLNKLYTLATLPEVKGTILDVMDDATVRQKYDAWNRVRMTDSVKANEVAAAIKVVLSDTFLAHPNIRYVVFVGGDEIIPFYRIADASETFWEERIHGSRLPHSSVASALAQNYFLTDDCYTDQTPDRPNSPLWTDPNRFLCVPDRITSRLVENPQEISAAIDAFLLDKQGRKINITSAIWGGDPSLTFDTISSMCRSQNLELFCGAEEHQFADFFTFATNERWRTAWSAFHSNQNASGDVTALGIRESAANYAGNLWINIGCHVGLNLPDSTGSREQKIDLSQSFLGKGGTMIGSSAYSYATRLNHASYSEKFLMAMKNNLTDCNNETVGAAFLQAKHQYYAEGQQLLDYIDEKSISPLTLYGLPMWGITGDTGTCNNQASTYSSEFNNANANDLLYTPVTVAFNSDEMPLSTTVVGSYYANNGQVLAQDRRPVQPQHHIELATTLTNEQTLRGVVLLDALYHDKPDFDPVIEQAWIVGENGIGDWIEPRTVITGWDHNLPYSLGIYPQLPGVRDSRTVGRVNLVLGSCDAETIDDEVRCKPERVFNSLKLQVLYSNNPDTIAPAYTLAAGYVAGNTTSIIVSASDQQSAVEAVIAICDDGKGHYENTSLQASSGSWSGNCSTVAQRFYVQVVDSAGNVTTSEWFGTQPFPNQVYLPMIMQNYQTPLPDVIVAGIDTENNQLSVAIRNIGEAPMADNIWIHLCIDPVSPLVRVNDVCKGRSYEYLIWAYPGRRLPILPDQTVTLLLGDDFYTPTFSIFSTTISIGTKLWAHVDSTNVNTTYGGTLETHEQDGKDDAYNNILGPVIATQPVSPPEVNWASNLFNDREKMFDIFPVSVDLLVSTVPYNSISEESGSLPKLWLPLITR